jgi:hypothetical protein
MSDRSSRVGREIADAPLRALAACARVLEDERERLEADWLPDAPPVTVAFGALGSALVRALEQVTDQELSQVVAVVETLLATASEADQNAVATGFIEAVLSGTDRRPSAARLVSMLGPRACAYARAWDAFCGTRTPGLWDEPS